MTVEDFLAKLDGVRRMGTAKFAAKCPAHEDRIGSLTVSGRDDGMGLVLHCHAGCDAKAVVEAVGYELKDLFCTEGVERNGLVNIGRVQPAPVAKPKPAQEPSRRRDHISMPADHVIQHWERLLTPELIERLTALKGWSEKTLRSFRIGFDSLRVAFPVYDPDGALVGLVRYLPGERAPGVPKVLAVGVRELFPAPESLPLGSDVWLVEGEPDAVSARELGLQAVALPGVGKWRSEWVERFAGRRVTICLDCDDHGRDAARARLPEFVAAGVDARLVDLFPGRTDGYDIGDALVAARESDQVADLCKYLLRLEAAAWSEAA